MYWVFSLVAFLFFELNLGSLSCEPICSFPPKGISIDIPLDQIPIDAHRRVVVTCTGCTDCVEELYIVICDSWERLHCSSEEVQAGSFNLLAHLQEFLPNEGRRIGLITEQNGMNTSFEQQVETAEATMSHIPEGTLYISKYNPTEGVVYDLWRVFDESRNVETLAVFTTRRFMSFILDLVHQINPDLLWLHISHSEGGLICNNVIRGMTSEQRALIKKHLYSISLASGKPISQRDTFQATNFYSEKDYFSTLFLDDYRNQYDYDIRVQACKSPPQERTLYYVDHRNMGTTYQEVLHNAFEEIRETIPFYDPKEP